MSNPQAIHRPVLDAGVEHGASFSSLHGEQSPSCESPTAHDNTAQTAVKDVSGHRTKCMGGNPMASAATKPAYVTRRHAAAILSCSDQTISKLHKEGRLPFYYLGRHAVRIRLADVEVMLSNAIDESRRMQ